MDLHICIDNTSILFFSLDSPKFYVGQGFGFFSSIDIDNLVQLLRCCKSSSYWHWKKTIVETFTGLPLERQYQYANERLNLILAQSEEQSAKFFAMLRCSGCNFHVQDKLDFWKKGFDHLLWLLSALILENWRHFTISSCLDFQADRLPWPIS